MTPYETAVKITEGYGFGDAERRLIVGEITTAIQAASNEQLARSRDGHLADVREFFQKFNVPIATRPAFPDQPTLQLRVALIAEEFCEFLDACGVDFEFEINGWFTTPAMRDFPKAVDGLLDMEYVTLGAYLSFGVDPAVPWRRVHLANMSKTGSLREDGKITKPSGFIPPDIEGALRDQGADL